MNSTRARLALTALAFAGAMALSGCTALSQLVPAEEPVRDDSGQVTEESDNADVFALRVGDCTNTSDLEDMEELSSIPVVPCSEPHDDEAFFAYELEDGDFPGEEAITADADETCTKEFETFIGIAYADSKYDYWPMYPSEGSWADGDREVICMVWDPASEDKITGSLEGAAL